MRIRNQKDFWAGVLCVAFGVFFAGIGSKYAFGTSAEMGPGYFPTALGAILGLLGLGISAGGLSARAAEEAVGRFEWKVLLLVLGPVVLFGALLQPLGLVLSVVMLVVAASLASHEFGWKHALTTAAILAALCVAVFVWALNLQFQLWPAAFGP